MYSINHNTFAFSSGLNESLLWKDKTHTNRKGRRQLAIEFVNNIRYQGV